MRYYLFFIYFLGLIYCSKTGSEDKQFTSYTETSLFQISTLTALYDGIYDGDEDLSAIKGKGNFGIGTFQGLDGEMVVLDGIFYQIDVNGNVKTDIENMKIPFINLVPLNIEQSYQSSIEFNNISDLTDIIKDKIHGEKYIYAIKIDGTFETITCRSVKKQEKPYPPISEVIKNQSIFQDSEKRGTVVGFYFPEFMSPINTSGIHFHFIDSSKTFGGHLLEIKGKEIKISIDRVESMEIKMLKNNNYAGE